ncbi:Fic family protein [Aquisalimonas sp. 2447]|uniref:Fic family protein n=1 Tax=Aquisalimonas sp. 2447 TaxID=2740807 RepID=UPI0014324A5D|nr:Fic family protein [Aquisalimonas sp. 2447]QIT55013.1 Fic family protein [Aquisalimonas sp. 2447]
MLHSLTPPRPTADHPALPGLHRQCARLIAADSALAAAIHQNRGPVRQPRVATVELIASNRIEGLVGAHCRRTVAVAALREAREILAAITDTTPDGWIDALCRVHARLAAHGVVDGMPAGDFRQQEVVVARHQAPPTQRVAGLMADWARAYHSDSARQADAVVDALCAHHRLLYIHPYRDGNGRLARLDLEARLRIPGLHCGVAWSVSAALARAEAQYRAALAQADAPRHGDLDGRGALSQAGLVAYCGSMLDALQREVDRCLSRTPVACAGHSFTEEGTPWSCA